MANVGSRCLVTLDEAHDYLKAETTDDDVLIAQFADLATAWMETWLGNRKLKSRTYDGGANNEPKMILSGRGTAEISVREYPVTSVSAIAERYEDGVTTRSLSLTGLRLLHGGRRIRLPFDTFTAGDSNIEVSCVAGYLAGTHDSQLQTLKLACLRLVQVFWQDRSLAIGRGANVAVGGESVSFIADAMPKDIVAMLRPFERWV